jgi:hypothetical protein
VANENDDLIEGLGSGKQQLVSNLILTTTTKSIAFPSLTTAERDALVSPPDGLVVYNETTNKLNVRANGAWEAVTSA